jgi:hypothetical protein
MISFSIENYCKVINDVNSKVQKHPANADLWLLVGHPIHKQVSRIKYNIVEDL